MKKLFVAMMLLTAFAYADEQLGNSEKLDSLRKRYAEVIENLDFLIEHQQEQIPDPMFALDDPQYMYFFLSGQKSVLDELFKE